MERRIVIATALAAGVTVAVGTFAFAAVGGLPILGLGAAGAAGADVGPVIVRQVQPIEDEIIVLSPTPSTDAPIGIDRAMMPTAPEPSTTDSAVEAAATVERQPGTAPRARGAAPTATAPPAATSAVAPPAGPAVPAPAAPSMTQPVANPVVTSPAPTTPSSASAPRTSPPTPTSEPADDGEWGPPTTEARPASTPATTAPGRPPGVPADWPPDRPVPPMPPNCEQPQLEDNGVWNCDH